MISPYGDITIPKKEYNLLLKYKEGFIKTLRGKRKNYDWYLESWIWKQKREDALDTHGRFCNTCGATKELHVHHKTYDNIYDEKMEDLLILCKQCHKETHGNSRQRNKQRVKLKKKAQKIQNLAKKQIQQAPIIL